MVEAEPGVTCFEDGGRGHKPRDAGGLWELNRQGNGFASGASWKD